MYLLLIVVTSYSIFGFLRLSMMIIIICQRSTIWCGATFCLFYNNSTMRRMSHVFRTVESMMVHLVALWFGYFLFSLRWTATKLNHRGRLNRMSRMTSRKCQPITYQHSTTTIPFCKHCKVICARFENRNRYFEFRTH